MENRIIEDFLIIANPVSGKGKSKVIAEKAYQHLTANGRKGELTLTTQRGDAKRLAQEGIRESDVDG